jgi:isocitrate dehydrogenase
MKTKIAVANGDGIGPEIMQAVLRIFEANNVPLEYEFVEMGKSYFDAGHSTGMTATAKEAIERAYGNAKRERRKKHKRNCP